MGLPFKDHLNGVKSLSLYNAACAVLNVVKFGNCSAFTKSSLNVCTHHNNYQSREAR
jgi:hypothetical protein